MQIRDFQVADRAARRAAFGQSIARVQQVSSAAVSTLLKVMVDPNARALFVWAADSVLNHSKQAVELEDVESPGRSVGVGGRASEVGWTLMLATRGMAVGFAPTSHVRRSARLSKLRC